MARPYKVEWLNWHDEKFKVVVWLRAASITEILAAAASEFPNVPVEELYIEGDSQLVILRKKGQLSY